MKYETENSLGNHPVKSSATSVAATGFISVASILLASVNVALNVNDSKISRGSRDQMRDGQPCSFSDLFAILWQIALC